MTAGEGLGEIPLLLIKSINVEDIGHMPVMHLLHGQHAGKAFHDAEDDHIETFFPDKSEKPYGKIVASDMHAFQFGNPILAFRIKLIVLPIVLPVSLRPVLVDDGEIAKGAKFLEEPDTIETGTGGDKQYFHSTSFVTRSSNLADFSQLYFSNTVLVSSPSHRTR